MNCVIIDDEPAAIDVLKFHLSNIPFVEVKNSFRDPLEALDYLQKNSIDLIFLDINMPKLSGVSFPKFLNKPPLIIFTTAYSEYALKSYELNAVDYLLKPIEFDRLIQAVMKVKEMLINSAENKIIDTTNISKTISNQSVFIKSGSDFHQLSIDNIKYIESDGNYVTFKTVNRSILARYKISEVLELLPKKYFMRIHRSYIIALKHIETVKKHAVIMDGKEIPISSNYREKFLNVIENMSKNIDNKA